MSFRLYLWAGYPPIGYNGIDHPHHGLRAVEDRAADRRRPLLFVVLIGLSLLAVTYPGLAAATVLGGVGGLLAGAFRNRTQA